jgi:predicted ATP-binding protein involved in virulence
MNDSQQKYGVPKEAMPNLRVEDLDMPTIKIKRIHFKNFKAFDDFEIKFLDYAHEPIQFSCLFGPNGCGKTTVLSAISSLFSDYNSYDPIRLQALLGKLVRHVNESSIAHFSTDTLKGTEELYDKAVDFSTIENSDDFELTADISCSKGDYSVILTKNGFTQDHPSYVKEVLNRVLYNARFDQELHMFQITRDKWPMFKDLFEAVTGFKIEEKKNVFHYSEDPIQAEMFEKYVVEFNVHKPDEIISHKECSAGERKIIKSFSTLLNKEFVPQIILIDNIAMHVESGRHLELVKALKRCFPNSQIFATTHSHNISKNLGNRIELHDLRFIKSKGLMRQEPWRIYLQDDIEDHILKLKSLSKKDEIINALIQVGYDLKEQCEKNTDGVNLTENAISFMQKIVGLYVEDTVKYYS